MSMNHVGVVKVLTDGLVVLRWLGGTASKRDGLWVKVKLRKSIRCAVTNIDLSPGDIAWRPVGNQDYRGQRISEVLMAELLKVARR